MADVESCLGSMSSTFANSNGTLHSLSGKEELFLILLQNEQIRLVVWLYPLDHEKRHFFSHASGRPPADVWRIPPISLRRN